MPLIAHSPSASSTSYTSFHLQSQRKQHLIHLFSPTILVQPAPHTPLFTYNPSASSTSYAPYRPLSQCKQHLIHVFSPTVPAYATPHTPLFAHNPSATSTSYTPFDVQSPCKEHLIHLFSPTIPVQAAPHTPLFTYIPSASSTSYTSFHLQSQCKQHLIHLFSPTVPVQAAPHTAIFAHNPSAIAIRDEAPRAPFSIEHSRDCASSTGQWHICTHKRAHTYGRPSDHLCMHCCLYLHTPTFYSLHSLHSLQLVGAVPVRVPHGNTNSPSTLHCVCRGSVPCRLLSVWSRGMWRVFVAWTCVYAHVPGSSDALTCGAIQAGPGHAHVPSLSDALTWGDSGRPWPCTCPRLQ